MGSVFRHSDRRRLSALHRFSALSFPSHRSGFIAYVIILYSITRNPSVFIRSQRENDSFPHFEQERSNHFPGRKETRTCLFKHSLTDIIYHKSIPQAIYKTEKKTGFLPWVFVGSSLRKNPDWLRAFQPQSEGRATGSPWTWNGSVFPKESRGAPRLNRFFCRSAETRFSGSFGY